MRTLVVILAYSTTCVCSILQAVQFYVEQLEHTDQVVRTGACLALCSLDVSAMSDLNLEFILLNFITWYTLSENVFLIS